MFSMVANIKFQVVVLDDCFYDGIDAVTKTLINVNNMVNSSNLFFIY